MEKPKLNSLQIDFLRAFFSHESSYFLSGGAALIGFFFGHRETDDLDLFTLEDAVESGFEIVRETARQIGATVEPIQTSPAFRRILVSRGEESISVDLIREYVYQVTSEKQVIDGIRIDSAEEIFANKLCAILSRSEIRDLVDVMILEKAGLDLETGLTVAAKKDSGLSPGQLAWVLSGIKIGDDAVPPGNVTASELQIFLKELIKRLQFLALPGE